MESSASDSGTVSEDSVISNPKERKRATFEHPPGPSYKRPCGFLQNKKIRQEIASLDAYTDCQRIVFLLKSYEFPSDITHSLELAI